MIFLNFENVIWNKKNYKQYISVLKTNADLEYREFNSKSINTKLKMLGVRVPIMRKIAKKIGKTDVEAYFSKVCNDYYEEIMIYGLVLSESEFLLEYFKDFISRVDNWAICDSFCSSLKIINKDLDRYFNFFMQVVDKTQPFELRFLIVVLLNYYLVDDYIDDVLKFVLSIKSEDYYVNMAISWLLAEAVVLYEKKVVEILTSFKLCKFVQNKTISKIRDSYRVNSNVKDFIVKYRIK